MEITNVIVKKLKEDDCSVAYKRTFDSVDAAIDYFVEAETNAASGYRVGCKAIGYGETVVISWLYVTISDFINCKHEGLGFIDTVSRVIHGLKNDTIVRASKNEMFQKLYDDFNELRDYIYDDDYHKAIDSSKDILDFIKGIAHSFGARIMEEE